MGTQHEQSVSDSEIPNDAIVIKQVQYAWLWSSMPWVIILAALFYIGIIPEPTIASIIILIIAVPRYMMWKGTAYILTNDSLIYQRGGLTGSTKYQIPFSKITDVRSRYGNFGRTLNYQAVDIVLGNGAKASLSYLPIPNEVETHILDRMDPTDATEGDSEKDLPPDHPKTYDPSTSKYDPESEPGDGTDRGKKDPPTS